MKKSIIKSLTAGLLIGSSLTMSACNKGDKVPTITDSSVSSSVAEYLVYDEFKADHLTLTLEMSDNTTKEIAITADMINKMPDMNTPGEKTVTIEYEGVEYTFTFTVGGHTREEMLEMIEEFMKDYNRAIKTGDVTVSTWGNYSAKYLGDNADGVMEKVTASITKDDARFDRLITQLYAATVGGLVESAGDITADNIINSNDYTASVQLVNALQKIFNNLLQIDYMDYILNDVIFPETNDQYVITFTDWIEHACSLDGQGVAKVKSFVNENLHNILNQEGFNIENLKKQVNNFNNIIQNHSSDKSIQDLFDHANRYVQTQEANIISKYFRYLFENYDSSFSIFNIDPTTGEYIDLNNTEEAKQYAYILEGVVVNVIEDLENITKDTVSSTLNSISTELKTIAALESQMKDDNLAFAVEDYELLNDAIVSLDHVVANFDGYKNQTLVYVSELVDNLDLPNRIFNLLIKNEFEDEIPQELRNLINNFVTDLIKFNKDIDIDGYIDDICKCVYVDLAGETEEYASNLASTYKSQVETTGYCTILSDLVEYGYGDESVFQDHEIELEILLSDNLKEIATKIENMMQYFDLDRQEAYTLDYVDFIKSLNSFSVQLEKHFHENYNYYLKESENSQNSGNLTNIKPSEKVYNANVAMAKTLQSLTTVKEDNTIDFMANVKSAIKVNQADLADLITLIICDSSGLFFADNYQQIYDALYMEADNAISQYVNNNFKIQDILKGYYKVIDKYCPERIKVIANSIAMCSMIYLGSLDESIDFNKEFEFLNLDERIANIDYNKFVSKIYEKTTYNDIIKITDIHVKYETDSQGNLDKEIMTVVVSSDFDVMLAGFNSNTVYELTIDL